MRAALERLPGVFSVAYRQADDTFLVQSESALVSDSVRRTVLAQVVFPVLRRLLALLGHILGVKSPRTIFYIL